MNKEWSERKRPARLERRYEFSDYESLRDFMERAAELSEKQDLYPDMGFGRDYLNVTIHAEESEVLTNTQREFAQNLDKLLS